MKKAITLILLVILVAGGSWFGYAAWSDNKASVTTKKAEESQSSGKEKDVEVAAEEEEQSQEKPQEKSPEPKDEEVEQPAQPDEEKEKSPEAEVKKEEPQSQPKKQDLNGTWSRNIQAMTGTLVISNATSDSFDFALDVETGGHPGEIDGTATVESNKATFKDAEFNTGCVLTFTLNDGSIDISQGNGCEEFHAQATSFEGTYDKGEANMPEETLTALGAATPEEDAEIKQLMGEDYAELVQNMIHFREGEDLDGFGGKVIFGGAPGLYTSNEGAIIIDEQGLLIVATLVNDGEALHVYTQNEEYADTLPDTLEEWRVNFSDRPVKITYQP